MVTTFFKLSRLISLRSALLGTVRSKAVRCQRPNSTGAMPWARATSDCRASAATWRTYSVLKTGVYFLRGTG